MYLNTTYVQFIIFQPIGRFVELCSIGEVMNTYWSSSWRELLSLMDGKHFLEHLDPSVANSGLFYKIKYKVSSLVLFQLSLGTELCWYLLSSDWTRCFIFNLIPNTFFFFSYSFSSHHFSLSYLHKFDWFLLFVLQMLGYN